MPPIPDSITRPVDLTTKDDQSTTNDRITSSEVSTSTRDESQQDVNSKSTQPPVTKTQQTQELNEQPVAQEVAKGEEFQSAVKVKVCQKPQLHFREALEQMPSYMKLLKDILANKRKIGENETVALTYECSALFQYNIPTKMKDPGSFTLPCSIGGKNVRNALCDLGASINLIPLSIFKKLNIDNARPTTITYNYEADKEVFIILGRPFLATGRAPIDVQKRELTIRVDDQQVKFNVLNALKYPSDMENCQYVEEFQEER
ncbi:uncharacterized protein LOC120081136 [Benincasa hispida]|uniref:uncharacterized protein LOC120081136 n=1 Tax=Benincasa hispida TaxID=102211 RepID=UPI001901669B|nr:uncharacterized protein LOC120081136 [Benincasa hispida]